MGDPDKIPEWYLLAKEVKIHQAVGGEEPSFNVEFTFFGDVFEENLVLGCTQPIRLSSHRQRLSNYRLCGGNMRRKPG